MFLNSLMTKEILMVSQHWFPHREGEHCLLVLYALNADYFVQNTIFQPEIVPLFQYFHCSRVFTILSIWWFDTLAVEL